jgi:hypothetical protein
MLNDPLQVLLYSDGCKYEQMMQNHDHLNVKPLSVVFDINHAPELSELLSCFNNSRSVVEDRWKKLRIFVPKPRQSKSFGNNIFPFLIVGHVLECHLGKVD